MLARDVALVALIFGVCGVHGIRQRRKASNHHDQEDGNETSFHLRMIKGSQGPCQVVEASWDQVHRLALEGVYQSNPRWLWKDVEEDDRHSRESFYDFWGPTEGMVWSRAQEECGGALEEPLLPEAVPSNTKVKCIYCTGDSQNRIDVVFMGDGYTIGERTRFFTDMQRLVDDMFADVTFRSYMPVFNLWAIHAPSTESGIGYNSRPKKTTFELFKQGTQHRGVLPTYSGQAMARQVCKLAKGCDYPSLIGNDEFYGGLGGEFVIGTRSKTTGTVVLRHEMGHNFVSVGEEYDNGGVYRGVNSDGSRFGKPKNNIKWKHWLTEPNKPVVEQKMRAALLKYPWLDLAKGRQTFTFKTDGKYSSWRLVFTVSGFPEKGSLVVKLDGNKLNWSPTTPPGAERGDGTTVDRQFYHFNGTKAGFSAGTHTLTFESGFSPSRGAPIRQLCSISIYEYGSPDQFNFKPGYVGAYPTWSQFGSKSYRPTNEQCLMRNMESTIFCPVCKEGMWQQFFSRMTLIDAVDVSKSSGRATVQLKVVPLAQFRSVPVPGITESLKVVWSKNGKEQNSLKDKFTFSGTASELAGNWVAKVKYLTSEVRSDPKNLLESKKSFTI